MGFYVSCNPMHKIHLLYGPTASGKSARALELAREQNGVVINADATQLYADLRILSARPDEREMQGIPHRLYGILPGDTPASAALWLERVKSEIETTWQIGKLPILCGGTGLYLKALQEGLSPMPVVPEAVRAKAALMSNAEIHARLCETDPETAARLKAGDTQRLRRAWEVIEASGKPFSFWRNQPKTRIFPQAEFYLENMMPPRDLLYARCDARFLQMLERGAVEEVRALLTRNYAATLPIMKAVGVPEISVHLRGEITLAEATARAQQATRNYAKRQLTWGRNQW